MAMSVLLEGEVDTNKPQTYGRTTPPLAAKKKDMRERSKYYLGGRRSTLTGQIFMAQHCSCSPLRKDTRQWWNY